MKKFFNHPIGIGISVFVVVLLLGGVLNNSGFHLQGISIVKGGNVEILIPNEDPSSNLSVFIDQKKIESNVVADGKILLENVSPGPHSILIFNEIKWPWKKDVVLTSNETTTLTPFLINKNPSGVIVTNKDEEFASLAESINETKVPNKDSALLSESKMVSVWVENDMLHASWLGEESELPGYFCNDEGECETEMAVLETADRIRSVDFFKDREDVVIVAFSNGVFALELDKRGATQNFQPIYKGTELPRFKRTEENTINVVDGSAIFIINL